MLKKFIICWVVCEDLETTGRITDAVACFHQISSEPAYELDGELANWTRSECPRSYPRHHSDRPYQTLNIVGVTN